MTLVKGHTYFLIRHISPCSRDAACSGWTSPHRYPNKRVSRPTDRPWLVNRTRMSPAATRNEASEAHRKFSLELIYIPSRIRNPAASVSREFFSRIFQYPLANNGRCCSWRHQKLCQPRHLSPGLRAQMRKEYFLLSNISLRNSTAIIVHLANVSQWSLSDFVVEAYEDN